MILTLRVLFSTRLTCLTASFLAGIGVDSCLVPSVVKWLDSLSSLLRLRSTIMIVVLCCVKLSSVR